MIVRANDSGTALMSYTECARSAEVGACSKETPKFDATWLLNARYGGISTGWRSTNARVCCAGHEIDAVTTVAVRLGHSLGLELHSLRNLRLLLQTRVLVS